MTDRINELSIATGIKTPRSSAPSLELEQGACATATDHSRQSDITRYGMSSPLFRSAHLDRMSEMPSHRGDGR